MMTTSTNSGRHRGISLLEVLAVVVIVGVLTVAVVPRITSSATEAQGVECHVNVGVIEVQASLWRRSQGAYPNATLSDIGADHEYFPDGLPSCPVDGTSYRLNTSNGRVIGHAHR